MRKDRKEDLKLIEGIKESDIIAVSRQFDFIENVFQSLGTPTR
ncbi:MAG: hypothetical protein ACTSUQ_00250 [Candidatus Freyarchaeota archaeon]